MASFIVDKTVDSGAMKNKLLTENFENLLMTFKRTTISPKTSDCLKSASG